MTSTENVSPSTVVDRQRHAIERDRPLGAMKRASCGGARNDKPRHVRQVLARDTLGNTVDMAGDQWPPNSSPNFSARSRLTFVPAASGPRS